MEPTPKSGRPSALRRYGPLGAIVVVVVVVGLVVALSRGGGDNGSGTDTSSSASSGAGKGPLTYPDAKAAGTAGSIDWGPNCDTTTGQVKVPLTYAPPCVEPYDPTPKNGKPANGGATAPGVTADTITIALYQAQPDELQQIFFKNSGSDEGLNTEAKTVRAYVDFFQSHYETWGRKIKIVTVKGSGAPDDETAAKADAIKVATEVKAFASFGGPGQTSAYADELATRGVLCLGDCMLAASDAFATQNAPDIWLTFPSTDQAAEHWVRFITRQVAGRKAQYAGDTAMHDRTRAFGLVRFDESYAGLDESGKLFVRELADKGVKLAAQASYQLDLARAQEDARTIITKMKAANVTTVIFAGDPVTPSYLTKEATAQNYFPEWIVLGAAYTDTSLFGRQYDQRQWAHAFGVSQLPAPVAESADQLATILDWQTGQPPAAKTFKVLVQAPLIFFTGLHLAGPELTAQSFRNGLFRYPSIAETKPTWLHISWGKHGIWPGTDWFGSDDATVIWWNPDATGTDEVGNAGTGMYEYADGGRRYLPDNWPARPAAVFDPATSTTGFTTIPLDQQPPSYPSPAG